ncbi:MAG: hypothetical protein ACYSUI_20870, partial [Planctomycetota bacterium]
MSANLVIIQQTGLANMQLRSHNACLGISYAANKFFSKSRVRGYILWCNAHSLSLLIIIPDHLEAYN